MADELLTVAEVAAELRKSEQTVRQWIRAGRLSAIRVGVRGYRVNRSELAQMVTRPPAERGTSKEQRTGSGGVSPERVDQVLKQLRIGQSHLQRALAQHRLAPPDAWFVRRLRDLANACDDYATATQSAAAAGFTFDAPTGDERPIRLPVPHELLPDSGRPGPREKWEAFDDAVAQVNAAFGGISYSRFSRAFARLSAAALAVADAVEEERRAAA